ncbi:MAG: hypothetical protein E7547_06950 [Ruminococcaceae bacterium]|nr:hypothetical protein [Oscillospiraceae bacterium]
MKKSVSVIAVLLLVCILFTSCDSARIIRPVDSLLSPPLYHEEYEELVEAFRENVSKDVLFCSPREGDYSSAIIVEDIDSDGATEAIIFYKDGIESSAAKMHYFNTIDGRWVSRGDFNGYGNEVKKAVITDMDADGNSEIIVIWQMSGVSSSNVMSVYKTSYDFDEYKEISNEMCTVCEVADVDGDSKKEIFYMNQITALGIAQRYARVMKISGDSVALIGEAKVDPNISSYTSVKTEKATGDSPLKFYIDALKGESQMITELIYWDKEKSELCAPLLDEETMSNTATLRYEPIASADVNNDGVIDIPVQKKMLGDAETESGIYVTDWIDYYDNEIHTVANTLINYSDGYMINFDGNELETTGIRKYESQNCWVVYRTDYTGRSIGELYSVLKISADRWDEKEFSSYIPIIEKDDGVICAYITQSGVNMGIDSEYISNRVTKIPA